MGDIWGTSVSGLRCNYDLVTWQNAITKISDVANGPLLFFYLLYTGDKKMKEEVEDSEISRE